MLVLNINNNMVKVSTTKTPEIRKQVSYIVNTKKLIAKSVQPKGGKFRYVLPRFRNKKKIRLMRN